MGFRGLENRAAQSVKHLARVGSSLHQQYSRVKPRSKRLVFRLA